MALYDYEKDGFHFSKSNYGDLLMIDYANHQSCSRYARENGISSFRIHWWGNDVLENGDFLNDNTIRALLLSKRCIKDWSFLLRHPELEFLSTGTGNGDVLTNMDFSCTPILKNLSVNWDNSYRNLEHLKELQDLDLWHFTPKGKDLQLLKNFSKLKRLNLVLSKCESLEGIEFLHLLEYLCIGNNKALKSFCQGERLQMPLKELWIEKCPKLDIHTIPSISDLKILRLIGNGKIDTIEPLLKQFPKLTNLVFVEAELLDGNLDYLLQHPTLERVTLDSKKHYNKKEKEINALLAERKIKQ